MLLPWNFTEQQTTDVAVSPPQLVANRWGNAIGDLTIGGAKTILYENGWIPGLLGRVSYEISTGPSSANGVPLVSGQDRLRFSLTALKRQDPLVFVGTGGYTKAFTANQINPGDQANFTLGLFSQRARKPRYVGSCNRLSFRMLRSTALPSKDRTRFNRYSLSARLRSLDAVFSSICRAGSG